LPLDGGGLDAGVDSSGSDAGASYRAGVLEDAPLGYWRLGEASGALEARDETGAHTGGYQGAITLGVDGISNDGDTALGLAGTNGSVQLGDALDFVGNVPITLEAWVWLDVIDTDYKRVIAKRAAVGGYSIFCQTNANGCAFELIGSGSTECDVTMDLGHWHHLVFTYDGSTARGYRDAIEVCNRVDSVTLSTVPAPLVIGAFSDGGNFFKGKLDEIAIYGHVLTPDRVAEHYARRKL
jgi:hypothetical protein